MGHARLRHAMVKVKEPVSDREVGWVGARALRPCERGRGFFCMFVYVYPCPDGDPYGYEDLRMASRWEIGSRGGGCR